MLSYSSSVYTLAIIAWCMLSNPLQPYPSHTMVNNIFIWELFSITFYYRVVAKLRNCKPYSILSFKMAARYYEQKILVSLSYTYKRLAGCAQIYVLVLARAYTFYKIIPSTMWYLETSADKVQPWPFIAKQFLQKYRAHKNKKCNKVQKIRGFRH